MISRFLQYLQYEKMFSPHTVLSYRNDLSQFCSFQEMTLEHFEPKSVSSSDILRWILHLSDEKNSARTVCRKVSTLKSFWRFLLARGLASDNPTQKIILPKTNNPLPVFCKQGELANLLSKPLLKERFESQRDRLIIDFLYQAGLRVSELTSLRDVNVDLNEGSILVLGKGRKTRIVPLGRAICEEVRLYRKLRDEQIECRGSESFFVLKSGRRMYNKAVYNIVRAQMSGVSTMGKRSPHVLRHTFATVLLNNGADINAVKELLGHGSLAATQVYTHVSFSELNKIYKQAHPRALKKKEVDYETSHSGR